MLFQHSLAYNFSMMKIRMFREGLLGPLVLGLSSCVTELPSLIDQDQIAGSLVVGRVITVLTGEGPDDMSHRCGFWNWRIRIPNNASRWTSSLRINVLPSIYRPERIDSTEGRSGSTQQLLHRLSEPRFALDALDPPCADPDVLKALL